ncbi:MAG: hypothetical protein QXG05_01310 [Nitrososphaerota archaeon]
MDNDVKIKRKLFSTKLCPRCLSPLKMATPLAGWVTPAEYYCEKCGYRGYIALEKAE